MHFAGLHFTIIRAYSTLLKAEALQTLLACCTSCTVPWYGDHVQLSTTVTRRPLKNRILNEYINDLSVICNQNMDVT